MILWGAHPTRRPRALSKALGEPATGAPPLDPEPGGLPPETPGIDMQIAQVRRVRRGGVIEALSASMQKTAQGVLDRFRRLDFADR